MIVTRAHLRASSGWLWVLGLALALGIAQPTAAKLGGPDLIQVPSDGTPPPTWYALALGRLQGRLGVAHYWSHGNKFRAVTLISGKPVLTIVNGPYYYTIDIAEQTGIRIGRNPLAIASDGHYSRPFAAEWEELIAAGGEKIRDEDIGGRMTEVWRLTNRSGRRTVWVSADKPMVPMRIETYDRKTTLKDSVDYVNWQHGLPLPAKFFEPPSGIKLDKLEYDEYVAASRQRAVGPTPPLYRRLLHGDRATSR